MGDYPTTQTPTKKACPIESIKTKKPSEQSVGFLNLWFQALIKQPF